MINEALSIRPGIEPARTDESSPVNRSLFRGLLEPSILSYIPKEGPVDRIFRREALENLQRDMELPDETTPFRRGIYQ